jgi:hypothetical protein
LAPRSIRGRGRLTHVLKPLCRAAVAFQLGLNPIDRGAIAIGTLAPVAELGQSLDRGFVPFEVEAVNQRTNRIGRL